MSSCPEKYVEEKPVNVEKEEASLPANRKLLLRLPRNE